MMDLDWNEPMEPEGGGPVTIPALPGSGDFDVKYGETPAQAAVRTISELREALTPPASQWIHVYRVISEAAVWVNVDDDEMRAEVLRAARAGELEFRESKSMYVLVVPEPAKS